MRDVEEAFFRIQLDSLKYSVEHIQIQLIDQTRFLQHGDKDRGREQTLLGVVPSCQRFNIANPLVDGADYRLEIDIYPPLTESGIKVLDNVLLEEGFFPKLGIIIAIHGGI